MNLGETIQASAHIVALVCVVWHMNAMNRNTPLLEMIGWWCLGVGSFCVIMWIPRNPAAEEVLLSIGVALLALISTQPQWRPVLANRRRNPEEPLPLQCDRRCASFMKTRSPNHPPGMHEENP